MPFQRPTTTWPALSYRAEAGKAMGLFQPLGEFQWLWPEKGGPCPTGAFKDMEAVPTIQRLHDHGKGLICASAAHRQAFSHFCGLDASLIVVVGKDHADRLWARPENDAESIRLVVARTAITTTPKPSPRASLLNYRAGK